MAPALFPRPNEPVTQVAWNQKMLDDIEKIRDGDESPFVSPCSLDTK
jgi:hypothetical protein